MNKTTKLAISVCMLGSLFALEAAPALPFAGGAAMAASASALSQTPTRITGVVTGLTMTSLTLRAEDGRALTFAVPDVAAYKAEGLSVGDAVDVFFVGSIEGASTSGTTVRKVEVVDEAAQPVLVRTIAGTVTDATMNTVAIRTDDGRALSFGTADADRTRAQGLTIGDRVQIAYTGTITGTSTAGVTVKALVIIDQAKAVHRIVGVVADATMNTLTLKTCDGRTLSFGTADADRSKVRNLTIGDTVRVTFTGSIQGSMTAGATVTAVETIADAAAIHSISGAITDATMNTITIQASDGRTLSFDTTDADVSRAQGLLIGSDVTIYYTGDITTTVTKNTTVLALVQNAPQPIAYAMTGTIVDATMNTVQIRTANGLTYRFGTADADKSGAKGLTIGSRVTVCYTGELVGTDAAGVTVTALIQ